MLESCLVLAYREYKAHRQTPKLSQYLECLVEVPNGYGDTDVAWPGDC